MAEERNVEEFRALAPVELIEIDLPQPLPRPGIALCLSGGGYRAMLFHLGTLWRLNEAGYLKKLSRVSSVSGGSITAAYLGCKWSRLNFDQAGVGQEFEPEVVGPIRQLAGRSLDAAAVITGALGPGSVGDRMIGAYREHLFGQATLQDLPDQPTFIINATNVQSTALWRFTRWYMADYRVGRINRPDTRLAVAVAASAAFPPFLSPVTLNLEGADYVPDSGLDLQYPPFTTRVVLTDGGVYDNLGLETAWKKFNTILVSDAGGKTEAEAKPSRDWPRHTYRILSLINRQVRALRKRQVIESYKLRDTLLEQGLEADNELVRLVSREGAYWGIRTDISNYGLATALPCPAAQTEALADIPTRLQQLEPLLQERLINWGYAVCDAAMRRHVDPGLPIPDDFPYPAAGVG